MRVIILFLFVATSWLFGTETKKEVLFISSTMGKTSQLPKINALIVKAKEEGLPIDFTFDAALKEDEQLKKLGGYKIVIFDSLAGASSLKSMLSKFSDTLSKIDKQTVVIPISIEDAKSDYIRNIPFEDIKRLNEY